MKAVDKKFLDDNFFILSSENISNLNSRLYGYAIVKSKSSDSYDILINGAVKEIPWDADGAFVNIVCNRDSIKIQQDCNGSYGLFYFHKDDYYAISNSYLYLLEYLKGIFKISLNTEFAKYFISERLASLSVSETLINEIVVLPKNVWLEISLITNEITFNTVPEKNEQVVLDSKLGMSILDDWYHKWQGILVSLQKKGENIKVDLTGGMDSRAVFAIFNTPTLDHSNILVNSSTSTLHTHKEDFEIASIIADKLGFSLNTESAMPTYSIDYNTSMAISFYTKMGLHKQFYFESNYMKKRLFHFTGSGGESIRKHWQMDPNEYIEKEISFAYDKFLTIEYEKSMHTIISRSIRDIENSVRDKKNLMKELYANTRLRSHFGKSTVEKFLTNKIFLNPLMDKQLQRIHTNDDTLLYVIYDRFLSQINGVKFEGKRELNPIIFRNAKKINQNYPYQPRSHYYKASIVDKTEFKPKKAKNSGNPKLKMMDLFFSNRVKDNIKKLLGEEPYNKAVLNWKKGGYFSESLAISLLSIATSYDASLSSVDLFEVDRGLKLYSNSNVIEKTLDILRTARIDIKNVGNDNNDVIFLPMDEKYQLSVPSWFQQNGKGYVVESGELSLDLVFRCINDGLLEITLRGVDLRDCDNQKTQCKIDYISLTLNGIEQLTKITETWHDSPVRITKPVKNGEVINLLIKWRPHACEQEDFINSINKLFNILIHGE